jgi:hypothetical protein
MQFPLDRQPILFFSAALYRIPANLPLRACHMFPPRPDYNNHPPAPRAPLKQILWPRTAFTSSKFKPTSPPDEPAEPLRLPLFPFPQCTRYPPQYLPEYHIDIGQVSSRYHATSGHSNRSSHEVRPGGPGTRSHALLVLQLSVDVVIDAPIKNGFTNLASHSSCG